MTSKEWRSRLRSIAKSRPDDVEEKMLSDFAEVEKERDDIKEEWNKWVRRNSTWIAEVITIQKERDDEHTRAEEAEAELSRIKEGARQAIGQKLVSAGLHNRHVDIGELTDCIMTAIFGEDK